MFNQYFGNYLLEKNLIKPEELRMVLAQQQSVKVKLGVLAIDAGYMNAEQVDKIHKLQAAKDKRFGELAIEEGYLIENQVVELLNAQKNQIVYWDSFLLRRASFPWGNMKTRCFNTKQILS